LSSYHTLFGISVEHGFYRQSACACLDFLPDDKTRRLFDNAGLMVKKTLRGIEVIYDETRLDVLRLYAEDTDELMSFDFKLQARDDEFRSFTEPFSQAGNQVLYFDNQHPKTAADSKRLSATAFVSSEDLKSVDAEELRGLISDRERLLPPEAVIRIFASNKKGNRLKQWLKPELTQYSIAFKPRQRYWKYYLLGDMARENFYIFDPDKKVDFEPLGEERLCDQRIAYSFRSKKSIPLHESYPYRFQLKDKNAGREDVVINVLPVAGMKQVGKEASVEAGAVVSEIYINS